MVQTNSPPKGFIIMRTLIVNGRVLDPSQKLNKKINVELNNNKIVNFFSNSKKAKYNNKTFKIIDAKGKIVSPGFIDLHVHLRDPGLKHKETIKTGSLAAAAGGFTSIACMPNTYPPNDNSKITEYILNTADKDSKVNIYPIGAITKKQLGKELANIEQNINAGCIAISDDGFPVTNSKLLYEAMTISKKLGVPVISHCEECSLSKDGVMNESKFSKKFNLPGIPNSSEELGILRDIFIAEYTHAHLHICHVSTRGSIEIIRNAKKRGLNITCEATPHHFNLCDEDIDIKNPDFKMNPPLRSYDDMVAIRNGIKDGTIDIIATDHAPHSKKEKSLGFLKSPFGIIGLETALPLSLNLVREKYLNLQQMINMLSCIPAKISKINRGTLKKGSIADIVIFDEKKKYKLTSDFIWSKSINTPFINKTLIGMVDKTIVDGNVIFENRK